MNTNEESTQFMDVDERIVPPCQTTSEKSAPEPLTELKQDNGEDVSSKERYGKHTVAGAAAGILIGSVASGFMDVRSLTGASAENHENSAPDGPGNGIGEVAVATAVDDKMTFEEAFDSARDQVGSGGIFMWHGRVYATYRPDEWKSLTEEQREDFINHFGDDAADESSAQGLADAVAGVDDEDVEVLSVTSSGSHGFNGSQRIAQVQPHPAEAEQLSTEDDIEIIGVVSGAEFNQTVDGEVADVQNLIVPDLDNEQVSDPISVDSSAYGQNYQDELFAFQDDGNYDG